MTGLQLFMLNDNMVVGLSRFTISFSDLVSDICFSINACILVIGFDLGYFCVSYCGSVEFHCLQMCIVQRRQHARFVLSDMW